MKLILSFILLFSISHVHSQELSQEFLKTLPKGLQDDVLDRVKDQGKSDEPTYSGIETQTKLEKKELEDLKKRLESDLEYLKEKLEENEEQSSDKNDLVIFGNDFLEHFNQLSCQ